MKKGNISDSEIAHTKLSLTNAYLTGMDSPAAVQNWYLSQLLKGRQLSPQEQSEIVNAVTKEQVIEAANRLTLDTIYVLTGNDDKAEEEDAE